MDEKTERKTNPVLQDVIQQCEEAARRNDAAVWQRVADELQRSNRSQRTVNLSRIERHTEDGDTVVVPGKVLGSGRLTKDVTVAAFNFSASAREAVHGAGTATHIEDLVEDRPDGSGVEVLG